MLHGFGASHESWNDLLPHLSGNFRVITLDLLGFGLSAKPEIADYSPAGEATVVNEFIDALSLKDVTLVGHSYGGGVALVLYLTRRRPNICRLVLLDAAGYEQALPFFVGTLRIPLLNAFILEAVPARIRARITLRHLFYDRRLVTNERIDRYARYFDMPGAHEAFIKVARRMVPINHAHIVRAIRTILIPTLVLWGENDSAINVRNAARFGRDIANSSVHVLSKCGHIPHEEYPDLVAEHIRGFVHGI